MMETITTNTPRMTLLAMAIVLPAYPRTKGAMMRNTPRMPVSQYISFTSFFLGTLLIPKIL